MDSHPSTGQTMGETVADFELPGPSGTPCSLSAELADRLGAVVVFWSGVCSHCQRYDEWLGDFSSRHPRLALLVVASRQNEDAAAVARVAAERGLRFPILLDADRRVARLYRVEQTPRAFLVDPQRTLLYRGAIDNFTYPRDKGHQPYLEGAIEDFLAGRPIRRAETPSFGCPIESVYYRA